MSYIRRKVMKRIIGILLMLLLVFNFIPVQKAYAAVKLNKTSLTLDEGKSYTLKITGTTKTIKWASSDVKIASVSSKGVVKAIKKGNANITGTVSGKKYTCKVTVKEVFNAKKAIDNLYSEEEDLGDGVIAIIKNNYTFPISLTATTVYYDENGNMLGKSANDNYYFEKGKECAFYFYGPYDSDYKNVAYSSYKITYTAEAVSSMTSHLSDISVTSNIGADNVMVEVTNTGETETEFTIVSVVFYKGGIPVGYDYTYADVEGPGSTDYIDFSFPYDNDYNTIMIDDYKVFINSSYSYTW